MIISGLEKLTLLDYPDKVAAIVFCYGCDLRCPYCHNPELVIEKLDSNRVIKMDEVILFLEKRKDLLDGVVITGGEPTLQPDLQQFIRSIKDIGLLVKLDTHGGFPEKVEKIVNEGVVDYWAMDVKYSADLYQQGLNGGRNVDPSSIHQSIDLIMNGANDYEFRTTFLTSLHNADSVHEIGRMILGAKRFYIQNFRSGKSINPNLGKEESFTQTQLEKFKTIMEEYVEQVYIR